MKFLKSLFGVFFAVICILAFPAILKAQVDDADLVRKSKTYLTKYLVESASAPVTANVTAVNLFAFEDTLGTTEATLWPGTTFAVPGSAATVKVSSTSADDASGGDGALTATIEGLGANHVPLVETVTLTGTTAVTTSGSFLRINKVILDDEATGTIWVGTGTVTDGVPATTYSVVRPGDTISFVGHYTVPAGHTAYLISTKGGIVTTAPSDRSSTMTIALKKTPDGGSKSVVETSTIREAWRIGTGANGATSFAEKTDITWEGAAASTGADYYAQAVLAVVAE